jgi:hypothetical protein
VSIKTYAYIIALLFIVGFLLYWFRPRPTVVTVTQHQDTTFSDNTNRTYRPQSIPLIERSVKPKVRLPDNIREKDVDRVITIVKSPHDSTTLIITKKGELYVDKQLGKVLSVDITTYLDPILSFGWYPKLGIDGNSTKVSPVVGIGFLEIYGKVQFPVFYLDLHGIGVGVDYKIFEPLSIGIMQLVKWDTGKEIRLSLVYNF